VVGSVVVVVVLEVVVVEDVVVVDADVVVVVVGSTNIVALSLPMTRPMKRPRPKKPFPKRTSAFGAYTTAAAVAPRPKRTSLPPTLTGTTTSGLVGPNTASLPSRNEPATSIVDGPSTTIFVMRAALKDASSYVPPVNSRCPPCATVTAPYAPGVRTV